MKKSIQIKWSGGEIEIYFLGCMMVPKFNLCNKIVQPLHTANWSEKNSDKLKEQPGIIKQLRGEFPCVPFGINTSIDEITEEWKETYSEEPYVVNDPHGFAANNDWDILEYSKCHAIFKIKYPEEDNIDYLIRTINVNNNNPNKINCSLKIIVKKDCSLPIGLHPMINIPRDKNKIKILPGKFLFGLTYPGIFLKDKNLGAKGEEFFSITKVISNNNKYIDLSSPPFDGNYEDLFQLCGVDGKMVVENYIDNYRLSYDWDPNHFSSILMWISNKGRSEFPWNENHITVGLEPITSAFGLSTHISKNSRNPISSKGISTSIKFYKNKTWITNYSFTLQKL